MKIGRTRPAVYKVSLKCPNKMKGKIMKTLLIVLALALVGCGEGYYGGSYDRSYDYTPRRTAPIKTYNETFPVLEWEVERNKMAIEEMERARWRERLGY